MVISRKRIFSRKIVAFCVTLSMIVGMVCISPKRAEAAITVKTISQLSPGDKVRFNGMKGNLDSTWTYCGKNAFECDKTIGTMNCESARAELIKLDSSVASGLQKYLVSDPFGGAVPEFETLYAEFWNASGHPEVYKKNGSTISRDQYYDRYANGQESYVSVTMLPAPDSLELGSEYYVSCTHNYGYGLTYPARKALTSSAAVKNVYNEKSGDTQYLEYHSNVYRNADRSFVRHTSGGAPVYPAIVFNTKGASELHFALNSGVYVPVEKGSITFDANGGSGSHSAVEYYYGVSNTVALPTSTTFKAPRGKVFKGWALSASATSVIKEVSPTTASVKVYAVWEPALEYKVVDGKKILTYVLPDYQDNPYIDPDTDVIAKGAFDNCSKIKNIVVPYSVTEIEEGAFQNINATTENPVTITIKNPECKVSYKSFRPQVTRIVSLAGSEADKLANEHEEIVAVSKTAIENTYFSGERVKRFICPEGVLSIGTMSDNPGVFEGHTELAELDLGKVVNIGARAFKECSGLKGKLVIPSTVTSVGALAFQHVGVSEIQIDGANIDPTSLAATGTDDMGLVVGMIKRIDKPVVTADDISPFDLNVILGPGVEKIEDDAFANKGIKYLEVKNPNLSLARAFGKENTRIPDSVVVRCDRGSVADSESSNTEETGNQLYIIFFYDDADEKEDMKLFVVDGTKPNSVVAPQKEGFIFKGYYLGDKMVYDEKGDYTDEVYAYNKDIKVTAVFEEIPVEKPAGDEKNEEEKKDDEKKDGEKTGEDQTGGSDANEKKDETGDLGSGSSTESGGTGTGTGSSGHSGGSSGYSGGGSYGGSGYSGGGSYGGSGNSGGGSSGGSGSTTGSETVTPTPIPTPVTTATPTPGTSVNVVNDPSPEEEITPPVVIEKIVTDISNISDAAELNGIKVKNIIRTGAKLTVRIKKNKGLKYQIRYTTKKKSWKGALKKSFSKAKVSINDLRYGKKYYFSIRAYKVVDGKKIYGKWSKRRIAR